jgi:hypothetical protein
VAEATGGELAAGEAGPTRDLQRPAADPWTAAVVPDGWEAVADLAQRLAADLDALGDHVVRCIERELPGYVDAGVPLADLHASVVRTTEMILVGVAERRHPTDDELAIRRELGVRRAVQGLSVDALVHAYHVGHRELWRALVAQTPDDDPHTARLLLEAATTVWAWAQEVTDAIAAAHARTQRRLEAHVVGARQRFVELLVAGDLDGLEVGRLARTLGFRGDEPLQVAVVRANVDGHDALELQRRVDELDGRFAVVARGALVVVVWQGSTATDVVAAVRASATSATVAVGAARPGLRGARASLIDAEQTLAVTADGATNSFDEAWLWATLADAGGRLRGLLAGGVEVAVAHAHLTEAVRAFGDHGFSVADAARHLEVHPNTVSYRLDRWAELTGWDPRTFPGLSRSLAALHVAGQATAPERPGSGPDPHPVHLARPVEVQFPGGGRDEGSAPPGHG